MKHNLKNNRNAVQVMLGLIGMVKPLVGIMLVAVIMGCIGNLMAVFLTVLAGVGIGKIFGYFPEVGMTTLFILIVVFAVLRGILRYTEQVGNHFIAFKLLARIRHKVFASLRQLAPAKLEGSEKGNLISIITSDIELLEVFYAHTISPIAIAVLTSLVMCLFIGHFYWGLGIIAAVFYLIVGLVIPVVNSRAGQKYGREYRRLYGRLNTTVLDNLYGLDEILQYQQQDKRMEKMNRYTEELGTGELYIENTGGTPENNYRQHNIDSGNCDAGSQRNVVIRQYSAFRTSAGVYSCTDEFLWAGGGAFCTFQQPESNSGQR